MAADVSFQIIGQNPTVEYIGGTRTQNVVTVAFVTNAHNIYGEARVPQSIYSAAQARASATQPATILETLASLPHVAGVTWGQDVNNSGLIVDTATVVVESASGDSTGQLGPWPLDHIPANLNQPKINALSAELSDAEGQQG